MHQQNCLNIFFIIKTIVYCSSYKQFVTHKVFQYWNIITCYVNLKHKYIVLTKSLKFTKALLCIYRILHSKLNQSIRENHNVCLAFIETLNTKRKLKLNFVILNSPLQRLKNLNVLFYSIMEIYLYTHFFPSLHSMISK